MPPVSPPPPPVMAAPHMGFIPLAPALLKEGLVPLPVKGGALDGRLFDIPDWRHWSMERRLGFIDRFIQDKGRDPQLREFAVQILNAAKVPPNQTRAAWAAILTWVQKNVRYSTEAGEQLQSPQYTLEIARTATGAADCDDMAILIGALGFSLGLPYRLVISGRKRNPQRGDPGRMQYVHGPKPETLVVQTAAGTRHLPAGGPVPGGTAWTHIYLLVGLQPLSAQTWTFAEGTLPVALGWDVLHGRMGGGAGGGARTDLAGADLGATVDRRPLPYLMAGPETPKTGAPAAADQGVVARTLSALRNAITPEAIVAVAVPTIIGIYAAQAASRAAARR